MIWLFTQALAGGIGAYGELSPGTAWTDASGPLVRGNNVRTNFGIFWGPYRSTLQYGRYQRFGLQWGAARVDPNIAGPLGTTLSFGPEYGRGIDFLKVGIFWKVSVNAAYFVDEDNEDDFVLGGIARLTGGAVYWFTRHVGFVARVEGGPDVRGTRGVNIGGGGGIGLMARVGVLTRQKRLRAEWDAQMDEERAEDD